MCPRPANPRIRETLLSAARAEFARQGLGATRVEDITRRAGISKGAFYLHFSSKQEVFRHMLGQFFSELEGLVHRCIESERQFAQLHGALTVRDVTRGTQRFRLGLELECERNTEVLETLWQNRVLLAILETAHGSSFLPLLAEFRERMAEIVVAGSFGKKASCCLRPDLDRAAVGDLIVGAYESFARRMPRMRRKPALRSWARTLLVVVFRGAFPRALPGSKDV